MRRAFYLQTPGSRWDYVNLLHLPYTAWHLSYVALGAAMVPRPDYALLGWTALAFFLAMGVGAHALDELHGRPLGTGIPAPALWALGLAGPALAVAIGLAFGLAATPAVWPCIVAGAFLVFAYNLEWGPFHRDIVFAFAWGAFPVLTSYLAQTGGLSPGVVLVAASAAGLSLVQRGLSKRARYVRRRVVSAEGRVLDRLGGRLDISREWLIADEERALALLSAIVPALALGLLLR